MRAIVLAYLGLGVAFVLGIVLWSPPGQTDAAGEQSGPAMSQPAAAGPASAAEGRSESRSKNAREAAGPLAAMTAVGLVAVAMLLSLWILRWGRRLRQDDRPPGPPRTDDVDPWAEAGRRLQAPDQRDDADDPDDGQERT